MNLNSGIKILAIQSRFRIYRMSLMMGIYRPPSNNKAEMKGIISITTHLNHTQSLKQTTECKRVTKFLVDKLKTNNQFKLL